MKLFNGKEDSLYLSKSQWRKIFLAMSIMVVALYIVAMIFSLCGSNYFILNYQNAQMDSIDAWLRDRNAIGILSWLFSTFEFAIVLFYVLKQSPKWYYILAFYLPITILSFFFKMPAFLYISLPFVFYIVAPLIELKRDGKLSWKEYGFCLIRLAVATAITMVLQFIIYIIKSGKVSFENHNMTLSANFCYAIEYDIALLVILFTISLYTNREKGDSEVWITLLGHGGFSQTSKKQSQKSSLRTLTKTQKNKLRLLWFRIYLFQLGGFLLLMVLPFLLGKVFEFLVMYSAFAVARYILGFKYSLHFKKETLCITAGVVVFGILSLAVPFFYVLLIIAVLMGVGLAVLLHLSYKYKGMFLFAQMAKPDKFAELYVIFDGNLDRHHVQVMCLHKHLSRETTEIICDFTDGNKKAYIAKKFNYSEKTIERKINEAVEVLKDNS